MALVVKDRVRETSTTTGTGTITLAGAVTGYQSFSAIGNGNTTYYTIYLQGGNEWEVGIGTYTASGTTLSRDTILASSNGGSAVNFSAGTKDVFVTYPAGRSVYYDTATNVTLNALTLSGGTANGVLYLNGSNVATSGSALTFDGTTFNVTGGASVTGTSPLSLQRPVVPSFAGQGAPAVYWQFYSTGTTYTVGAMIQGLADAAWTSTSAPTSIRMYTVPSGSTSLSERLRIAAGGQVNIGGNFDSTNNTLQVTGNAAIGYTAAAPANGLIVSGNVGIGTDNPAQKLDVQGAGTIYASVTNTTSGSGSARLKLFNSGDTSDGFALINNAGASGQVNILNYKNSAMGFWTNSIERMLLDSSGNLGLGVTPSAWYTSYGTKAFQFAASGSVYGLDVSSSDRRAGLMNNGFISSTGTYKFINAGQATQYEQVSGKHVWSNSNNVSGSAGGSWTPTEAMTLDASGNLVIGDTAGKANSRITLYRNNSSTDFFAANPTLSLQNSNSTNNAGSWIGNYDSTGKNNSYIGFVNIDQNYAGAIVFGTSNSGATNYGERARIDSSGTLILRQSSNAANTSVSFNTTVQDALTLDSSGNLGLGVTPSAYAGSDTKAIDVNSQFGVFNNTTGNGTMGLLFNAYYSSGDYRSKVGGAFTGTYEYSAGTGIHTWKTSGLSGGGAGTIISLTSAMTLDASGNLLVGTTTTTNNLRANQKLAIVTAGNNTYTGAAFTGYSGTTAAAAPIFDLNRSRGTTDGSMTVVASGDRLGLIIARGSDGTNFVDAASIDFAVDGTPGSNDMPGRIVFSTTADGASGTTERARITSGGYFKASNNGTYNSDGGAFHELRSNSNSAGQTVLVENTGATLTGDVLVVQAARNTTNNTFYALSYYNAGAAAYKFRVADSGAIATAGGIALGTATPATSGIGVQFPATQSASSDANTLDDYEEGTCTSSITPSTSGTIPGSFDGTYTKIGQQVTVTGEGYVPTAVTSPVGYVKISLPFPIGTTGGGGAKRFAGSIVMNDVVSANVADFVVVGFEGASEVRIYLGNATTLANSADQFKQYTDFKMTVTYFV